MWISNADGNSLFKRVVCGLLVLLPFLMPFFKPAASIGIGIVVTAGLIRLYLDGPHRRFLSGEFRREKWVIWTLILFLGWMALGVLWSPASDAFRRLLSFDELLLVPFITWVLRDWLVENARRMFGSLLAGSVIASLVTLYFYFFPEQVPVGDGYWYILRREPQMQDFARFGAYSPFLDRLYFAYLLGFSLLVIWIRHFRGGLQAGYLFSALIITPGFVVLGGRGALIALAFGLILSTAYGFFSRTKDWAPGRWQIILLAALILLPGILFLTGTDSKLTYRFDQLKWELNNYMHEDVNLNELEHQTVALRLVSWEYNLKLISENPVLGTGTGGYRQSMRSAYESDGIELRAHTNQQFLFFGVEGGIPSMLLFLLLFFLTFFAVMKNRNRVFRSFAVGWWAYMAVVMAFDSPLNYQMPAFLFLLIWWGVYFASDFRLSGDRGNQTMPSRSRS